MPPLFSNKRFRSLLVALTVAVLTVGGLMLLMNRLAASKTSATGQFPSRNAPTAKTAPAADSKINDGEVMATVNDERITRRAWQRATRLDGVMSQLAGQPIPTAEETLDRLINEIIVLAAVPDLPTAEPEETEAKITALEASWQVTDVEIVTALQEAGLDRTDLSERVGRLLRVEAALDQLAVQEKDLDAWLAQARASAEIGLYHTLANSTTNQDSPDAIAASSEPESELPPPNASISNNQSLTTQNLNAPPPDLPTRPYPGHVAPDFTRPRLDGESLSLSDFRGQPVLINFWASWCPPCRRELPALQAAYAAHGAEVGFIAVDVKENAATVDAFVEEMGLEIPVVLDTDGSLSNVAYEVRGLPTTLFVDANGVVAARHVGPLDEALIGSYLAPLIASPDNLPEPEPAASSQSVSMSHRQAPATMTGAGSASVAVGDLAPEFSLTAADGTTISLQDYRNKSNVLLIFYRGHT